MRFKRASLFIAAAFLCAGLAAIAAGTGSDGEEDQDSASVVQSGGETATPSGGTGLHSVNDDSSQPAQSDSRPPSGRSGSGRSAYSGAAAAGLQVNQGLSGRVMARASQVSAEINRTGGYRADGRNDCYGFVRRAWDPEMSAMGKRNLPVSDFVSRDWAPVTSWSAMVPGDVLGTHQGHMWGPNWHGGLFAGIINGKPHSFDASPSNRGGAYIRPAPSGLFRYYYVPTHKLLTGQK